MATCGPWGWVWVAALWVVTARGGGGGPPCPAMCRCLEKGSIMTCRRAQLAHVPQLLSTAMLLDLDHNRIGVLDNASFVDLPRLEMLSLEDNGMMYVEPGAFATLEQLTILRLGRNRLSSLPEGLFINNRHLEVLDLHLNFFATIPDHLMYHLHSLQSFNVSYNQLTSAVLGNGFRYPSQIASVDMSGNSFTSLEARVFQVSRAWAADVPHHLNLSYCGIQHIHPRALTRLTHLTGLSLRGNTHIPHGDLQTALTDLSVSGLQLIDLSNMNISNIYEFFRHFRHETLLELYLAHNNIALLQRGTFYYLVSLVHLDLSFNNIQDIDDLKGLTRLETLHLSHNHIDYLDPTVFEALQNLRTLDLSYNSLVEIHDTPFQTLFDLHTLDVSWNRITDFHVGSSMESLETLIASSNLITDAVFLQRLRHLHYVDLSDNLIDHLGPDTFSRGHQLRLTNFSHNCITGVSAQAFGGSSHRTVDLSSNKLTSLANVGWQKTRRLLLRHNNIYNLTTDTFSCLEDLEELDFSFNHLYGFPRGSFAELHRLRVLDLSHNPLGTFFVIPYIGELIHFYDMQTLQVLSLSHIDLFRFPSPLFMNFSSLVSLDLGSNQLASLPEDCFEHLPRLQHLSLENNLLRVPNATHFVTLRRIKSINLASNPFDCTCDLLTFQAWVTSGGKVTTDNSSAYQCASPPEWQGVSLREFHLGSSACSSQEKAIIFTAVGCLFMALVLTLTVAVLKFKWWQRRKAIDTEYSFIDDTSTSALTGGGTVHVNLHSRQWV